MQFNHADGAKSPMRDLDPPISAQDQKTATEKKCHVIILVEYQDLSHVTSNAHTPPMDIGHMYSSCGPIIERHRVEFTIQCDCPLAKPPHLNMQRIDN